MNRSQERILLSWSGGKESIMALRELQKQKDYQVAGLIATLCDDDNRVTLHNITREVLEAQAQALGLPLTVVYVPKSCCRQIYNDHLNLALASFRDSDIRKVAFGDLYLDDLRDYREECLEAIGMEALFPLWQQDTKELSWAFVNAKYKAVVTCVATRSLPPTFVGRLYDRGFLADLPLAVDPCGENGEFHTFVFDGPLFNRPLAIKIGAAYSNDHGWYCCDVSEKHAAPKLGLLRVGSV